MDQRTLVVEQIEDGKRFLDHLTKEGVPLNAAAWIKESESGRWYLYLATPLVAEGGAKMQAYRRILPLAHHMPQPFSIDRFAIKAVSPSAPLAKAIASLHAQYPGRGVIRYPDSMLGDMYVEDACIYPPITAAVP